MIAAAGADQLIHVGVAALDTAVHDADRLATQDDPAAVTRLAGRRGCHDGLGHNTQPRITAITRARRRGRGRTGTSHDVGIAKTAHSNHHREEWLAATGVWSRLAARNSSTRAVNGHAQQVSTASIHRALRHCWLAVSPRDDWCHHRRLPAYHYARMPVKMCVSSPEPAVGVSATPGTRQDRL
jgi:hypothetical protein